MTDTNTSYQGGVAGGDSGTTRANGIVDKVRSTAAEQLANQKNRATDGLGTVAQAVRQSTQQLRSQQHDTIAQYADQVADQIDRFSQRLRNKDIAELMRDIQGVARKQPALFIGGAFALGLVGARFFKSSSNSRDERSWANRSTSAQGSRADVNAAERVARRSYEPPEYSTGTPVTAESDPEFSGEPQLPGDTATRRRTTPGGRTRRQTPGESS